MRPLTDDEIKVFFEKLSEYIGRNIKSLIDREDEPYCFRLHQERVYYVSERVLRQATSVSRDDLVAFGVCMGKFTKSKKFRLKVTALDVLSQHAKFKVWVKPGAEQAFLYGNHVSKAGLARMTEAIPQYAGVIVLSAGNVPLGFGRASQTTERCKDLEATAIAILHQCDIGEYLREEADLI